VIEEQEAEMSASTRQWVAVGTAALAIFMAMLGASIVNVALPRIGGAFGVSPGQAQWVALGYLMAVAAVVLPSGRWLDGVGRRSALVFVVAGFGVTSAVASLAPTFVALIGARIAQGVFGAVVLALVPALVASAARPEDRGKAIGLVATIGPLGSVSGPPIGGVLVSALGWRSIFLVNLPITVALIAAARLAMPADERVRAPRRDWWAEAGTVGGAVLCAMLAVSQATPHGALWLLLLGPAGLLAVAWSRLAGSRPVVSLLSGAEVGRGLTALLLVAAAVATVQFLAPFFLERSLHADSATTGLVVLALPAAMATVGLAAGAIVDRVGARPAVVAGALLLTAGLILTLPLSGSWQPIDLAWRLSVIGAGLGMFNGPNQTALLFAAPASQRATVSAASGLARSLAFATGPLVATTAWGATGYQPAGMRYGIAVAVALAVAAATLLAAAQLRARRPGRARGLAPEPGASH
jgi:MFS transporter, DHA2 family, multidrug resistance protein